MTAGAAAGGGTSPRWWAASVRTAGRAPGPRLAVWVRAEPGRLAVTEKGGGGAPVKRVGVIVAGSVLLVVGVLLLVLPGPGLLLVLAGLITLASEFPALERYVDPVRDRAMKAAEDSVSSPLRIAGSVAAGLLLIAAGVVWALVPSLPLGGWSTGSSLVLSGLILLALLVWSYRRVRARRSAPGRR